MENENNPSTPSIATSNILAAMAAAASMAVPQPQRPRFDWNSLSAEEQAARNLKRAEHDKLRAKRKVERNARRKARRRK